MSIEISRSANLTTWAMDVRSQRQKLISSNIANADTPFYKPRDIDFKQAFEAKRAEIFKDNSKTLKMASTNDKHLKPEAQTSSLKPALYYRDGHMARNDGNSVDIDVETTEMSKNSIMFNALVQAKRKDSMIFKSVIEASQKLN
jgi:flagellar basal-body rod protein FlgB